MEVWAGVRDVSLMGAGAGIEVTIMGVKSVCGEKAKCRTSGGSELSK